MNPAIRMLSPWLCLGSAVTSLAAPEVPAPARFHHSVPMASSARLAPAPAARPLLGVVTDRVSAELRHQLPQLAPGAGLIVRELAPGSAAAKAGVERLDILVAWNDQMLVHPAQLQVLVENARAGDPVTLGFLHRGEMTKAVVTLEPRSGQRAAGPRSPGPRTFDRHRPAPPPHGGKGASRHAAPPHSVPHGDAPHAAPHHAAPPQSDRRPRKFDLEPLGQLLGDVKPEDIGALLLQGLDLESVDLQKLEEALGGLKLDLEKLGEVAKGIDFDINRIGRGGQGLDLDAIDPEMINRLLKDLDPEALRKMMEGFGPPRSVAPEAGAPPSAPEAGAEKPVSAAKIVLIGPGGNRTEFPLGEALKPGGDPRDALKSLDLSRLSPADLLGGKLLLIQPDGSEQEINPAEILQNSDVINQFLKALGDPK
jgi:hypothetical protein